MFRKLGELEFAALGILDAARSAVPGKLLRAELFRLGYERKKLVYYQTFQRLVRDGFAESIQGVEPDSQRQQVSYRITPDGRKVFGEEMEFQRKLLKRLDVLVKRPALIGT